MKFAWNGISDNKPILVYMMACCRKDDDSLLELMLIQFADAHARHSVEWVKLPSALALSLVSL